MNSDGEQGFIRVSISEQLERQETKIERLETEVKTLREVVDHRMANLEIAMTAQKFSAAGWGASMGLVFSIVIHWIKEVVKP